MNFVLVTIIIALALFAAYLIYQIKLQKHYYEYKAEKMDSLENELKDEQEQHKITLNKLNKIASASWEICTQVMKQQLELDMEQQTGSK